MGKERIVFHGVNNLKIAKKILVEGFKPYTYFALHLEDSLEFGGEYIFYVALDVNDKNWQLRPIKSVPRGRIVRLIQVSPKELYKDDVAHVKYFGHGKKYPCPNCGTDIGNVRLSIFGKPTRPKCPSCKKSFRELFQPKKTKKDKV